MENSIYNVDSLTNDDKQTIMAMEEAMDEILDNEAIDSYLSECYYIGGVQGKLFKEWAIPFMKFLRARAGKHVCEWMMDKLDNYPEESISA